MAKKRKTRSEKIRSSYRLKDFRINEEDSGVKAKKDVREFSYLSREYVEGDLKRSVLFSLVIILIETVIARYWV